MAFNDLWKIESTIIVFRASALVVNRNIWISYRVKTKPVRRAIVQDALKALDPTRFVGGEFCCHIKSLPHQRAHHAECRT